MPEKWEGTNILMGGHFAYMIIDKPIPARTTIDTVKVSIMYRNQPSALSALFWAIWQETAQHTLTRRNNQKSKAKTTNQRKLCKDPPAPTTQVLKRPSLLS